MKCKQPKKPISEIVVTRAIEVIEALEIKDLSQVSDVEFKHSILSETLYLAYGEPSQMTKAFCFKVLEQIIFFLRYQDK
jgi:hypothetical protein